MLPVLVLSIHPGLCQASTGGFRDLVAELRTIDQRDADGKHLLGDARLREIEDRVGTALELPPELRAALTRSGLRTRQDYSLQHGSLAADLVLRSSELALSAMTISLDGEWVLVETLLFEDPGGGAPENERRRVEGRSFRRADLPRFCRSLLASIA